MKNLKSFIPIVIYLFLLYSCSPDDTSNNSDIRKLQVNIADFKNVYESTAGDVEDDNQGDDLQLLWNGNDAIGIFPNQDSPVAIPMARGARAKSVCFDSDAWRLNEKSTYSAFYPLTDLLNLDKTKIHVSMKGQVQEGNASYAHIGTYDYMAAINSVVNSGADASIGGGTFCVDFQHLISILHLSIDLPSAGKYTKLLLEADRTLFVDEILDLSNGGITHNMVSPVQELDLKDIELTSENLVLDTYIAIRPINLKNHTLTVKVYDEDGNIYAIDQGLGGREFVAGTIYHVARTASLSSESTALPKVIINTPNNVDITSKEDWLKSSSIAIVDADGAISYQSSNLSIRGRGNSTWYFPKKAYALKLESKSEILGMPKHKRWILLANWLDRTLLRNDIAFQIAKQTDLSWTPSGKFVEVILNGNHIGNYYLCEQIKIDKNRLNIKEMKSSDISGDALTGGYLMELDTNFDEVNKFKSSIKQFPYMFKGPDEETLQPEQKAYFENYINTMEEYLYADNWLENREYADYMDIGSFIDWWFVYELTMCSEPLWPKSSYVHKDMLGKLKAGPVWDFDWETFKPSKSQMFAVKNAIYYERLFEDPAFVSEVKRRWSTYKDKFDLIPIYIQNRADMLRASNSRNIEMWPITADVNGDNTLNYDDAIDRLKSSYRNKLEWLDAQIRNM